MESNFLIHWPRDDRVIDLVFLGIDGVLHLGHRQAGQPSRFTCLARLEAVLRSFPSVEVVLTGSRCQRHTIQELRHCFSPDIAARIVGLVPGCGRRRRQRRIDRYLGLHRLSGTAWLSVDRWAESVGDYYVRCYDEFGEGEAYVLRTYLAGGRGGLDG